MTKILIPQHYQVPNILIQFPNLNWQDILVFGALNIGKDKKTYETKISQAKLGKLLGVDRRKISRHIQHLLDAPVIQYVRTEGRCKVYKMPQKYSHFECFSPEFLRDPNLTFEEKAYLLSSQQFYVLNKDNSLSSTLSNFKMCSKLKMPCSTIYKVTESLENKGILTVVNTNAIDQESGTKKKKYILWPEKYGQAILFLIKQNKEDIEDLKSKDRAKDILISQLANEIQQLRTEMDEMRAKYL